MVTAFADYESKSKSKRDKYSHLKYFESMIILVCPMRKWGKTEHGFLGYTD